MPEEVRVDEAAFIYDWEGGVTTKVMGQRYGMADSNVSKRARRLGLSGRRALPEHARAAPVTTSPAYGLYGGDWVPRDGIMRWVPHGG